MIGTWLSYYNEIAEIEREKREQEMNDAAQYMYDPKYSSKLDSQMKAELMQKNTISYAELPQGSYIYPEDIIKKIREKRPRVDVIGMEKGLDTKLILTGDTIPKDVNGHRVETFRDLTTCQVFAIKNGDRPNAITDMISYPEIWASMQITFTRFVVPLIKFVTSNGYSYQISSSFRGEKVLYLMRNRGFYTISTSDHWKGCAFDFIVKPSKKSQPPPKILNAALYRKILLKQVPNFPSAEFIRQCLLEYNGGTSKSFANTTGWVHIAGKRFKNDKTTKSVWNIMEQSAPKGVDNYRKRPTGGKSLHRNPLSSSGGIAEPSSNAKSAALTLNTNETFMNGICQFISNGLARNYSELLQLRIKAATAYNWPGLIKNLHKIL